MAVLTNNAEGGTNGATVTQGSGGNSGGVSGSFFDAVSIGASATLTYDNTHVAHGNLAYKFLTGGSAVASLVEWSTSLGSGLTTVWFRIYCYLTANPASNFGIVRISTGSGGSLCSRVSVTTTGKLTFLDGTNTTQLTTTNSIPLNAWFRVEGFCTGSATVGQLEVKLFTTMDSPTPLETQTSGATLNTTGTIGDIQFGNVVTNIANETYWADDIGVSTTGYLGPAFPVTNPYLVGKFTSAVSQASYAIPVTTATGSGDFIQVCAGCAAGAVTVVSQVTDSKSNTYTQKSSNTTNQNFSTWVSVTGIALTTADTITVTYNAATTQQKQMEAIGIPGAYAVDVVAAATNGNSAAPSISSGVLGQANEVVIASVQDGNPGGTPTGLGSFTSLGTEVGGIGPFLTMAYQAVSATSSVTFSCTITSTTWACSMVTYRTVGLASHWSASRTVGSGTGVPAPPSMPLACPVSNTGLPGNGLIAFCGWTLPTGYLGADMAVTDDAHNKWWPLGAPQAASPSTGFTRSQIWASPAANAAGTVYLSPCGLPDACYPAVMGIAVAELAGVSPYLGTPAVVTAVANAGTTISANVATPSGAALMLATAASDTTGTPVGPGSGWTSVTGVSASGGGFTLNMTPAYRISPVSQTATWTTPASADLSAASAAILGSPTAPAQPNPHWPAVQLRAGFGSGALTPPGQIGWTDLTSRWLGGEDTNAQTGKQYELDLLQAADITIGLDDNDGSLTPGNTSGQYFPNVITDVPVQLIMWWLGRTYGVTAGFVERWPASWDESWYGITKAGISDAWALQQNQLNSVIREETSWDPNLTHYWPCSDIGGATFAQNLAPGAAAAVLQVVTSKNGALTAVQSFANNGGALPGDSSATFWQQSGLTSGAEGYGYALYCADQNFPALINGITIMGWFNANGGATQVQNAAQSLTLIRGTNAGSGSASFQVSLESPNGANPGAIRMQVWDISTQVKTTTNVDTGDWLTQPAAGTGFFHIALIVTQGSWKVFVNGTQSANSTANLPSTISWLQFMGSADRQYTGSMLNGQCGQLAVFSVQLSADRIRAIYLAGAPNPVFTGSGNTAAVVNAQFAGDFPATRIERLLAYGGWTGPRSISQTSVTAMTGITDIQGESAVVAATGKVTVSANGQQAAQAINNIVFSDGGFIFTDGNGTLCYISRGDFYTMASKYTLGENTGSGELPYLPDVVLGFDKSLLYDAAELTPANSLSGVPVVAVNGPAIAAHGEFVYNATAYQSDPNQILDQAEWIINTRGVVSLRAEEITSQAANNDAVWPYFLGVQPAMPVTINRRPQEGGYTVTLSPITAQVTKDIDFDKGVADVKVRTDMFPEGTVMLIGDSVRGQANGSNILAW